MKTARQVIMITFVLLACVPVALATSDLAVVSIDAPPYVDMGEHATMSYTVENQGDSWACPSDWWWFLDRVYLSQDDQLGAGDVCLYPSSTQFIWGCRLGPGESKTHPAYFILYCPWGPGNYYLIVDVDIMSGETNTANNSLAVPVRIRQSDLAVTDITAPAHVAVGEYFTFSWTVQNQGDGKSISVFGGNSGAWYDRVYLSIDDQWSSDDVQREYGIGTTLLPGQSYTTSGHISISEAGDYYLIVRTDDSSPYPVFETNEDNNTLSKLIRVGLWIPVASTSPATDVTKQSATLNGSVTDDGGEACQYRFRYKEENGEYIYTSWTGSVTTGQSFSEAISGLQPNVTYYFNAQVKNSVGESAWGSEQMFIARLPEIPVASFKCDPQRPKPDEAIVFDASKSEDKDGWIVSYAWDFGDGTSASTSLPIYDAGKAYEMPGDYVVKLTVTDNDGRVGTATSTIKVKPKEFMLTFDDGPIPGQTDSILLQLMNCKVDGEPVRAAFFMLGDARDWSYFNDFDFEVSKGSVQQHPDAVTRVYGFGHVVGNHTQHHAWFPKYELFNFNTMEEFIKDEISKCNDEIKKAIHASPRRVFRAPYLQEENYPLPIYTAAGAVDFIVVGGKVADGTFSSVPAVQEKAREILEAWQENEPVVLIFHDNRSVTYNHIGEIVSYLHGEGYRLVHFDPDLIPVQTGRGRLEGVLEISAEQIAPVVTSP